MIRITKCTHGWLGVTNPICRHTDTDELYPWLRLRPRRTFGVATQQTASTRRLTIEPYSWYKCMGDVPPKVFAAVLRFIYGDAQPAPGRA